MRQSMNSINHFGAGGNLYVTPSVHGGLSSQ